MPARPGMADPGGDDGEEQVNGVNNSVRSRDLDAAIHERLREEGDSMMVWGEGERGQ